MNTIITDCSSIRPLELVRATNPHTALYACNRSDNIPTLTRILHINEETSKPIHVSMFKLVLSVLRGRSHRWPFLRCLAGLTDGELAEEVASLLV